MVRAKNGTRISNLHIANNVKDSSWINNHNIGILNTVTLIITDLLDESGLTLLDEAGLVLTDELIRDGASEITTISFVGNEKPTPNAETGLCKSS